MSDIPRLPDAVRNLASKYQDEIDRLRAALQKAEAERDEAIQSLADEKAGR